MNTRKTFLPAILTILALLVWECQISVWAVDSSANAKDFLPKDGIVTDENTAEKIAEAVLVPVFGQEEIDFQKPFEVKLENGIWIVKGQLPADFLGGVFEVRIRKQNGEVIYFAHSR